MSKEIDSSLVCLWIECTIAHRRSTQSNAQEREKRGRTMRNRKTI